MELTVYKCKTFNKYI